METILKWLTGPLIEAITPICSFWARFFNPAVAIILAIYSFVQWITRTMTGQDLSIGRLTTLYESLQTAVAVSVFGNFPSGITNAVAFINYVFPVTEGLLLLAMLLSLYVLAIAFRVIKSFIPSVA